MIIKTQNIPQGDNHHPKHTIKYVMRHETRHRMHEIKRGERWERKSWMSFSWSHSKVGSVLSNAINIYMRIFGTPVDLQTLIHDSQNDKTGRLSLGLWVFSNVFLFIKFIQILVATREGIHLCLLILIQMVDLSKVLEEDSNCYLKQSKYV